MLIPNKKMALSNLYYTVKKHIVEVGLNYTKIGTYKSDFIIYWYKMSIQVIVQLVTSLD